MQKYATFKDIKLPRIKAERFLRRVLAGMAKGVKTRGVVVARMQITGSDVAPNYRFERPSGEPLQVIDGITHKPLAGHEVDERSRSWSSATMTYEEISDVALELISAELDEVLESGRTVA